MDKYDKQIAGLMALEGEEFREAIQGQWFDARGLFAMVPGCYACLTMIHSGKGYKAPSEELTKEIQNDPRIPDDEAEIEKHHLPVFAEWQRRIDRELRNVKE